MKLYGSYTSPFVRHCRIVLLETNTPYTFVETDQAGSAEKSPTKRVPFLEDGDYLYSDSSAIIKHLREKFGQTYCSLTAELNEICLVNTALEAAVNLFFLERDGIDMATSPYLQRQAARIESCLRELDNLPLPMAAPYNDAQLRLACFVGWAKFRKRLDFEKFENIESFFAGAQRYENFKVTEPYA
jgi:glutathione S-transferase